MATAAENIITARNNLLAALAEHGHKRRIVIDGYSVDSGELWDRLAKLNAQLAAIEGPYEHASIAETP